jgi:SRSO17 transposase
MIFMDAAGVRRIESFQRIGEVLGNAKRRSHSVGAQRQYTGSAGKITNCQIGVSLSLATHTEHVPVDFELYLPESWTEDPARRKEARIPGAIQFQTKPQLGIAMVRRALADGLPRGVVLADSAYGCRASSGGNCTTWASSTPLASFPKRSSWSPMRGPASGATR